MDWKKENINSCIETLCGKKLCLVLFFPKPLDREMLGRSQIVTLLFESQYWTASNLLASHSPNQPALRTRRNRRKNPWIQTSAILGKPAIITSAWPKGPMNDSTHRVSSSRSGANRTPQAPTGATSQESMILRARRVHLRITRRKMSPASWYYHDNIHNTSALQTGQFVLEKECRDKCSPRSDLQGTNDTWVT